MTLAINTGALPTLGSVMRSLVLRRGYLAAALGIAIVLVVAAVVMRPLIPIDETRYLTVAWEMRLSHDWLVPHLNGEAYSHKPPMLFWLINLGWTAFGQSEVVARLIPAAFLPVVVWLTARLGAMTAGNTVGDRAALIGVSFLVFAVSSTLVMFDAMLTAACLAGLIGLVIAAAGRRAAGFGLLGLMIGAGLLIKGPAVLIHLMPAALLAPLWTERRQNWFYWYLGVIAALTIGAAIGLAWALPAAQAGGPEFAQAILWGQTTGRMVQAFDHARPVWYFLGLAPLLLAPWTFSRNLWSALRDLRPLRDIPASRPLVRLPWIVAGGSFVLFSLVSGKQAHYLAPAMPMVAIGMAALLARRPQQAEAGFAVLTFVVGALLVLIYPLGLMHESWPPVPFAIGGGITMALSVIVWRLRSSTIAAAGAATVSIFVGLHVSALLGGLAIYDPSWVTPMLGGDRPVAVAGSYAGEYGYAARLTRPVTVIAPEEATRWLARHPDGVLVSGYKAAPPVAWQAEDLRPYRTGMLGVWMATPTSPVEQPDAPSAR